MASDTVNHPEHYGGDTPYEVIKVLDAWGMGPLFCLGNAIKYIARAGKKGPVLEDLKKARWYLDHVIEKMEEKSDAAAESNDAVVPGPRTWSDTPRSPTLSYGSKERRKLHNPKHPICTCSDCTPPIPDAPKERTDPARE